MRLTSCSILQDEDSVDMALSFVDNAIQYGEDLEPKGEFALLALQR